jgi:hypothetical protein
LIRREKKEKERWGRKIKVEEGILKHCINTRNCRGV